MIALSAISVPHFRHTIQTDSVRYTGQPAMIPIRDVIPSRTTPYVTFSLIIANALAFLYLLSLPAGLAEQSIRLYGVVPAESTWLSPTLVTSMFLHGGWSHLL